LSASTTHQPPQSLAMCLHDGQDRAQKKKKKVKKKLASGMASAKAGLRLAELAI
jgi:hypothetical protein